MKILVIGANGQIGRELSALAVERSIECAALNSKQLNIARSSRIARTIKRSKADVVINAAGYTQVDQAEIESDAAMASNAKGVDNLAYACAKAHTPLIHLSSSYVFDGEKPTPYAEEDAAHPLNAYGRSKWLGEEHVRRRCAEHIILRTNWVFSEWSSNFVKLMVCNPELAERLDELADQVGAPTPASDVARVVIAIAQQVSCEGRNWGTYHYTTDEAVSRHQLVAAIMHEVGDHRPESQQVMPVVSGQVQARRPVNLQLNCQKVLDDFGVQQRSWRDELARVVAVLCQESEAEEPVKATAPSLFKALGS